MRTFKVAAAAALLLALTAEARASVIVFDSSFLGSNVYAESGVTFTTNGPNFAMKTLEGVTGVGVAGANEEIDLAPGDSITAAFSIASHISSLDLSFLYNGPEFEDFREVAKVRVNDTTDYFLTTGDPDNPLGDVTATWSGLFGTVSNLSPAIFPGGGALWRISNPFGDTLVTSLVFTPVAGECGTESPCTNQSDYSLTEMSFEPVPEPGTLILLGAGLAGLGARRRRKA